MGSYGWGYSNDFGGGPSADEKMYNALRSLLGEGGIALEDDTIDALEIQADAQALASMAAFDERAALQIFPGLSIDNLSLYEEILGITPSADQTDAERQQVVETEWPARNSAETPTLLVRLQAIDSRISILDEDWSNAKVTRPGMPFYPFDKSSWMNPPDGSSIPFYSSRSEFFVLLNLGAPGAIPTQDDLLTIARIKNLLKIVLPAWVVPYVITEVGLIAGVSPVGYAGVTGS